FPEAEPAFREALRLKPDYPEAHAFLGSALAKQGKLKEAEEAYREAIRLNPDDAKMYYNLGHLLYAQGRQKPAEEAYREAIRLNPDYAQPHCNLGQILLDQGRLGESLAAYQRGHELGSKQPHWPYPSAQWVRKVEHLVALDAKLQMVLQGEARPIGAAES